MASINLACQYVFQGTVKLLDATCSTQFDCAGTTNGSIICDPSANPFVRDHDDRRRRQAVQRRRRRLRDELQLRAEQLERLGLHRRRDERRGVALQRHPPL